MSRSLPLAVLAVVAAALTACTGVAAGPHRGAAGRAAFPAALNNGAGAFRPARLPQPAHVVVVVEENQSYGEVVGNRTAPYLQSLIRDGALFTHSFAITHPSQPNYLALFSGSTHGIRTDSCPHTIRAPNLAAQLRAARRSFTAYVEGLPAVGSRVCDTHARHPRYTRDVAPWTDFVGLPASVAEPIAAFPRDYAKLPSVAFVTPALQDDMHQHFSSVSRGDRWLRRHLAAYADWARSHDSLLVITWDEARGRSGNRIPTIMVGAHVRPGRYGEYVNHYRLLRTIEALQRLPGIGAAARMAPISDVWTS